MIHVRRAGPLDAGAMVALLNAIIAKGETTAYQTPWDKSDAHDRMQRRGAVWHLAEDDAGALKGFQWFEPHPDVPEDSASIATYVEIGATGLGIGSQLFVATKAAALEMGYRSLDAVIRADNTGGLAYYQSRGFETIKLLPDMPLGDGSRVDKVWTRVRLD